MWLWLFAITAGVLMSAGILFGQFFWWSMIAVGVLTVLAVVAETLWNWWQERALGRQTDEETPAEAPAVAAASKKSALGKAG
jgi:hypothetical protein